MSSRIKLSKTGWYLLGLTALFLLSVGAVRLLTPRTVRQDYTVEALAPPAQNEEKARLEYMIEYSGSESYLIQYPREKLGYVRSDEIKFDIDGNK